MREIRETIAGLQAMARTRPLTPGERAEIDRQDRIRTQRLQRLTAQPRRQERRA